MIRREDGWGHIIQMRHANKSMIRSRRFFDKVSSHFHDLSEKIGSANRITISKDIIEPRIGARVPKDIIEPRIGERVLDIGNGGLKYYNPPQTSYYVGIDFSLGMLRRGKNRTYDKVCGEAMSLPFKEEKFNTTLYLYLLHHLAQGSIGATNEAVKKALREGATCLKAGGNVIIAETCLPHFLERVERVFFPILRVFLLLTKQSEVFLFSAETLTQMLTECGYREIRTWKFSIKEEHPQKWVRISIGLPLLKIPRWMNPSRNTIFEARS